VKDEGLSGKSCKDLSQKHTKVKGNWDYKTIWLDGYSKSTEVDGSKS
jgi:hypothetical protein